MFKKTIILASFLNLFLGLNACNKNENLELIPSLSKTTLEQISTISAVLKSNPDVGQSILNALEPEVGFSSIQNVRAATQEIPAELKAAMDEFNANPSKVLTTIAQESQGAEKIALLEGLFTNKDALTLEKRAEVFTPIDLPSSATVGFIPSSKNGRVEECTFDCRMHIMAGAAISLGVSTIALSNVTWFTPILKAALLVAVGVSVGILAGAAKEAYDKYFTGGKGTVEWRDFWYTVWGSVAGGAVGWVIAILPISPLASSISMGITAAVVGVCPAIHFLSKGSRSC